MGPIQKYTDAYAGIRNIFSSKNASKRVADMIEEMAGWKR
jgi:hypothetical protein